MRQNSLCKRLLKHTLVDTKSHIILLILQLKKDFYYENIYKNIKHTDAAF